MKKIMFNDKYDLTKKVISGQKTMTRREMLSHKPKYHIGEIVAIAQCYKMICKDFVDSSVGAKEFKTRIKKAKALLSQYQDNIAWTNKLYIKAEFMLHHIKITGIHSDRLQNISTEDCDKEGLDYLDDMGYTVADKIFHTPQEAFAYLIDKISGKGTWKSNPFVWIYEFKRVD